MKLEDYTQHELTLVLFVTCLPPNIQGQKPCSSILSRRRIFKDTFFESEERRDKWFQPSEYSEGQCILTNLQVSTAIPQELYIRRAIWLHALRLVLSQYGEKLDRVKVRSWVRDLSKGWPVCEIFEKTQVQLTWARMPAIWTSEALISLRFWLNSVWVLYASP